MIKKKNGKPEFLKNKAMRKVIITLIGSLSLFLNPSIAQNTSSDELSEEKADFHLDRGEYENAYEIFDKLTNRYPGVLDYKFKLGICCLNYPDKNFRAIELFDQIRSVKRDVAFDYYLARAYHVNYKFDEAVTLLDQVLSDLGKKPGNKSLRSDAKSLLTNCRNGQILKKEKSTSTVEAIKTINTKEFEAVPILTSNDSVLIFTYVGKNSLGGKRDESLEADSNGIYCSDIYMSVKNDRGDWTQPKPINDLNTIGNDAALATSPGGDKLFLFMSTNKNPGDIYVCERTSGGFSNIKPLNGNVNSDNYWEGSCALSPDSRFLYFVSDRPGGLGGRDIWVSEFVDGDWRTAVNLGPSINTPGDEDAPFMHADGITLFFSSKGHSSIGGYDILYATKKDNDWSPVKNLGMSVNTTGDDNYFSLNAKCDNGVFSSSRSGGHGESDIYVVSQIDYRAKPPVKVLIAKVNAGVLPTAPLFEVLKKKNNEIIHSGYYNQKQGDFKFPLSPASEYRIRISAPDHEVLEYDLITEETESYQELKLDFTIKEKSQPDQGDKAVQFAQKVSDEKTPVAPDTVIVAGVDAGVKPSKPPQLKDSLPMVNSLPTNTKPFVPAKNEMNIKHVSSETQQDTPRKHHQSTTTAGQATEVTGPRKTMRPEVQTIQEIKIKERIGNVILTRKPKNFYFSVQIGAFRHPENVRYGNLSALGKITSHKGADGITRFTQNEFETLIEAEGHRKKLIQRGVKNAWIVVFVNEERKTLSEFLADYEATNVQ